MKRVIVALVLLLFVFVLFSGCSQPTSKPPETGVLTGTPDDPYAKRDNPAGQEFFTEGGGTALEDSNMSFEEFEEEYGYKETMKDVNIAAILERVDCAKRGSRADIDYCYQDSAVAKNDESICDKIVTSYVKIQCFRNIAMQKESVLVCKNIDVPEAQYYCVSVVAVDQADEKICDAIPPTHVWYQKCLENVAKEKEFTPPEIKPMTETSPEVPEEEPSP